MIPNRCSAEINVKVCVAAFHAHETIPAAEKEKVLKRCEKAKKKKTLKDSSRNALHKHFSSENGS